jgi:hypothetical protein
MSEELASLLQLKLGWDADLAQQVIGTVKERALDDDRTAVHEIVQARRTGHIQRWR